MAPLLGGPTANEAADTEPPTPTKKVANLDINDIHQDADTADAGNDDDDEIERDSSAAPPHPLGVKPLGNKYLSSVPDSKLSAGLFGGDFPDEIVMMLLEGLDATSLCMLGSTCRFLYAFCAFDELWKALTKKQPAVWHGTWRASFLAGSRAASPPPAVKIDTCVFSDVLHRPFVCSYTDPARYARGIPRANQIRRFTDLAHADFTSTYSSTPFVLTDSCVRQWPVLDWTLDSFAAKYASTPFRAESVDWPYWLYSQYMHNTVDESPLYLFDKKFAEKMQLDLESESESKSESEPESEPEPEPKSKVKSYCPPECFGSDLFEVLGPQRPAHRWLIIGPARSGSTFHKDPNGTSAWNAVVRGAKYWIMFPPGAQVPGVYVSADKSEVTSPLSIAEWLLTFHAEARATPGCIEGVCSAGEILHVPSGWWHLVVNLEAGIALTQNFVPRAHLADVLLFLRDRPEQVTGFVREDGDCLDAHKLFVERLREEHADVLAEAEAEIERRDSRRKRTWESVVHGEAGTDGAENEGGDDKRAKSAGGGFTFGFGFDDDDLEEE